MGGKRIDWGNLAIEYRRGVLSLEDMAEKYGARKQTIITKAKEEGWTRDLAGKIAAAAAKKISVSIASEESFTLKEEDEAAIVDAGSDVLAHVSERHRRSLKALSGHALALIEQYSDEGLGLDLMKRSQVLERVTGTVEKIINLERKVFNMEAHQIEETFTGRSIKIEFIAPDKQDEQKG